MLSIIPKLLSPNGMALIQIRYDNNDPRFTAKTRHYARNLTTFTSYQIDEFWEMATNVGLSPAIIKLERIHNYAYFPAHRNADSNHEIDHNPDNPHYSQSRRLDVPLLGRRPDSHLHRHRALILDEG